MDENDIQKVATPGFLARADALRVRYQDLIIKKQNQLRTLTEIGEPLEDGTIPVVIAMRSTTDGRMSTRGNYRTFVWPLREFETYMMSRCSLNILYQE
jgi:hypothetical protein